MTTYETYREQMKKYASETAHLSVTQYKHPSFQAMLSMGTDLVPHLIGDLLEYHTKYIPSGWMFEFDPWCAMTLLWKIVGDDSPIVPEEIRGRLDPLCRLWIEWGKRRGYIFLPTQ